PNRIFEYDSSGNFIKQIGADGTGDGQFGSMRGVAMGPEGDLYVVDAQNGRIQVIDTDGNYVRQWGSFGTQPGQFSHDVRDIAIDADNGWAYVSDANYGIVDKYALDGTFLAAFTAPGTTDLTPAPRELTVGQDHNVYLADYSLDQVDVFDPNGNVV